MTFSRKSALACAALLLAGCALPQESKTFHFSREDWNGTALSARGRITVADSVAGAAPNTITILEIGGLSTAPRDPAKRIRVQDERARTLTAALERRGAPPANIAIETLAVDAAEPLWQPAKPMVIVIRY